jgi:murein DD-endopeptidase MepM/ murein hydrolase activator NlpD
MVKKKLVYAAAVGTMVAATFVAAPAAQASVRDGICQSGEFCLYYNSNHEGSVSDFTTSIPDYGATQPDCYEFKGAGAGQGLCVKNEAASAWNRTGQTVTVFYNSGYAGASQSFAAGAKVNLNATLKNENASHRIGSNTKVDMSDALYVGGGGRLTTPFDGYETTPGRHEGIDFAKASGSGVKALLGGTVTNVVEGGTSLSTIAIYNATYDKTIIYLHTNPLDSVDTGDSISKGQQIATEASRGASAAHTHVEMRLGRRTLAAKSVDDPVLDNPNPNPFWEARGYNVR